MSILTELTRGIDHVAFGTRDLGRARSCLQALGLSHTPIAEARWPREDGPNRARTLTVMLADGYLDVIEFREAGEELAPTGVVWTSDDLVATRERMIESGIRCARPYTIVRCFDGTGPDQRYEIFGIEPVHANGLPQSVIETRPAPPMQNQSSHRGDVTDLREAARLLGVDLE